MSPPSNAPDTEASLSQPTRSAALLPLAAPEAAGMSLSQQRGGTPSTAKIAGLGPSCGICQLDLSFLGRPEQEQHMNLCLDGCFTGESVSVAAPAAGTSSSPLLDTSPKVSNAAAEPDFLEIPDSPTPSGEPNGQSIEELQRRLRSLDQQLDIIERLADCPCCSVRFVDQGTDNQPLTVKQKERRIRHIKACMKHFGRSAASMIDLLSFADEDSTDGPETALANMSESQIAGLDHVVQVATILGRPGMAAVAKGKRGAKRNPAKDSSAEAPAKRSRKRTTDQPTSSSAAHEAGQKGRSARDRQPRRREGPSLAHKRPGMQLLPVEEAVAFAQSRASSILSDSVASISSAGQPEPPRMNQSLSNPMLWSLSAVGGKQEGKNDTAFKTTLIQAAESPGFEHRQVLELAPEVGVGQFDHDQRRINEVILQYDVEIQSAYDKMEVQIMKMKEEHRLWARSKIEERDRLIQAIRSAPADPGVFIDLVSDDEEAAIKMPVDTPPPDDQPDPDTTDAISPPGHRVRVQPLQADTQESDPEPELDRESICVLDTRTGFSRSQLEIPVDGNPEEARHHRDVVPMQSRQKDSDILEAVAPQLGRFDRHEDIPLSWSIQTPFQSSQAQNTPAPAAGPPLSTVTTPQPERARAHSLSPLDDSESVVAESPQLLPLNPGSRDDDYWYYEEQARSDVFEGSLARIAHSSSSPHRATEPQANSLQPSPGHDSSLANLQDHSFPLDEESVLPSNQRAASVSANITASNLASRACPSSRNGEASLVSKLDEGSEPSQDRESGGADEAMPDYSKMTVVELRRLGSRYGLGPIGKASLVKELTTIWECLHRGQPSASQQPLSSQSKAQRRPADEPLPSDSMDGAAPAKTAPTRVTRSRQKKVMSSAEVIDFHDHIYRFLIDNESIYDQILRYEPLDLPAVLKQLVQATSLQCNLKQLCAFMDSKGINFTLESDKNGTPATQVNTQARTLNTR
ncbi:uncharacterized protein BJ171DRAFT_493915 [Polychytrium aggregatum]|uniref:uncharacterized protein n=1 Tax=Polychytrium aggregatum TaxID=110093 RepID=UPI0022FF0BC3|nr:uncharacterized protein BJ171DRAFT_493915 [Polychytrium aggregatum]KAI9207215.1 hypothetical protein BJ171DRAFT_493915 [Polychytrium aggregatum]